MEKRFEDAEIRVAQFCPLDAPLRMPGESLKGLHQNEPDMHARGVFRLLGALFSIQIIP